MFENRPARSLVRLARTAAGALVLGALVLGVSPVGTARAQADAPEENDLAAQKQYWQDRYRELLHEAARLKENARIARENYSRAQRRNYPRGGAREAFLTEADESEKKLAALQDEIAEFQTEAQRQGAYPGWLYEVEDEPIDLSGPASPENDDGDAGHNPLYDEDNETNDAGRNPLYVEDEDEG